MGMVRHDAYTLLLQGNDVLTFLNGLSTNRVEGACTTVFTNRSAKIVDVCEVVPVGDHIALIGYAPHKQSLVAHLTERILGQDVSITDISQLNDVFIGTGEGEFPEGTTHHNSRFGSMVIVPVRHEWQASWDQEAWTEHRIEHQIPFYAHEITQKVNPLKGGLGDLVHPQKGCYIGQEVLTRMRTRNSIDYVIRKKTNPVEKATTIGQRNSLVVERVQ